MNIEYFYSVVAVCLVGVRITLLVFGTWQVSATGLGFVCLDNRRRNGFLWDQPSGWGVLGHEKVASQRVPLSNDKTGFIGFRILILSVFIMLRILQGRPVVM